MTKPVLAAILSCKGLSLSEKEKKLFSQYNPLGISLFARNLKSKPQVKSLIKEIKETIGREDVLIAVDEEGGRVSRLDNLKGRKYVSEEILGNASPVYSKYHAILISEELSALGINVNYAPVVDKITVPQNIALESRCFSSDSRKIVKRGQLMAETYMENGICPCIKHIPGHFDSECDPHLSLPQSCAGKAKIKQKTAYLQRFNAFPMAMISHILLPAWNKNFSATQSAEIISELVRSYLGYNGFLLSDAIDMQALSGSIQEKVKLCINAGLDSVCCCSGRYEDLNAVCRECRFLDDSSLEKLDNIKKVINKAVKSVDFKKIEKQYKEKFKDKLNIQYTYDATEVLHSMLKKGEK